MSYFINSHEIAEMFQNGVFFNLNLAGFCQNYINKE